MQVERQRVQQWMPASGARVRNTYATYPLPGNSSKKFGLMSHKILEWHHLEIKDLLVMDGHAVD